VYWTLHSIAAYVALWQLFRNPFYWEKTTHGLTRLATATATAALIAALVLPTPASAGPWTPPRGHGQVIFGASIYNTSSTFDEDGTAQRYGSDGAFRKIEVSPYVEFGLTDRLALVGNFFASRQRFATNSDSRAAAGQGDSTIGLRYRLTGSGAPVLAAVTTGATLPTAATGGAVRIGDGQADGRLGMAFGGSIGRGPRPGFWNADTTYRRRASQNADEIKIDAGAGMMAGSRLMLIAQTAITRGLRNGSSRDLGVNPTLSPDYDLYRLQGSAVVRVAGDWRVEAGAFRHVKGRNTGAGGGVLVALWKSF
jgi:hypothetical protein